MRYESSFIHGHDAEMKRIFISKKQGSAKRVLIIHGWGGGPDKDWMPWAKRELEKRGFEVHLLSMPDPDYPKINTWVEHLRKEVDKPDGGTILVGHSMGCQTILRYLETLQEGEKVDKAICVAGWFSLTPEAAPSNREKAIARPWIETPIDFEKIRSKANSFIAVFSDNDPYVIFEENAKTYREKLEAEIIVQKDMGHFSEDTGVTKLPILLELIEK